MAGRESLGKVELQLLQLVERLQPVSVRTIADELADSTGQARTTVLTTLERLRRKGYLSRKKINGVNHYCPRVKIGELLPRLVADFVQQMLGGSVSPVVAYLQDQKGMDPAELARLKSLVQELESRQDATESPRKP